MRFLETEFLGTEYESIWKEAKDYLKKGRWFDISHTIIVVDFAKRLCRDLGGDPKVVIPASILHDVGYSTYSSEPELEVKTTMPEIPPFSKEIKEGHLIKGAELSEKILRKVGYTHKVQEIVFIVRNHERADGEKPDVGNLNHSIVSDADSLARITDAAIGYLEKIYGKDEVEIVKGILRYYKRWFITERALEIAGEELRKLRAYQKISGIWCSKSLHSRNSTEAEK